MRDLPSWAAGVVSRETYADLKSFEELVRRWSPKINLVSAKDLPNLWGRHILDSVQVWEYRGEGQVWADLGSGGGFPAIPLAIMAKHEAPDVEFILVESDQRKCAFLSTAIRNLDLKASIRRERIENLPSLQASIVTARALSDLSNLLSWSHHHLTPDGRALFMKGASWKAELDGAQLGWRFRCEVHKSFTNADAVILEIEDIELARSNPH